MQVDVKHLQLGGRRFYQFTAIDEATDYRVLRVYAQNSIKSLRTSAAYSGPPQNPQGPDRLVQPLRDRHSGR